MGDRTVVGIGLIILALLLIFLSVIIHGQAY